MADFMTNLWEAIFVAGPTPTLLLATNVTFAALQTLLLALLIATYSIHFVVLSALCAGLWFSINWFAAELRAVQEQQEQDQKQNKEQVNHKDELAAASSSVSVRGAELDGTREEGKPRRGNHR